MDVKAYLFAAVIAFLLESHLGNAYSFKFEYINVGGTADSRNQRDPLYQVGLDVGLAVGLGFAVPAAMIIFLFVYAFMCRARIARMDQETPQWQKTSQKGHSKAAEQPQQFSELQAKEQTNV